jgi:hypothetical protein
MPLTPLPDTFWEQEQRRLALVLAPHLTEAVTLGIHTAQRLLEEMLSDTDIPVPEALTPQEEDDLIVPMIAVITHRLSIQITHTTESLLKTKLMDWLAAGYGMEDFDLLSGELSTWLGQTRAEAISISEITAAVAGGNIALWSRSPTVEGYDVVTAEDELVCPICQDESDGSPYDISDSSHLPYFHTRCRCWIRPIVSLTKLLFPMGKVIDASQLR